MCNQLYKSFKRSLFAAVLIAAFAATSAAQVFVFRVTNVSLRVAYLRPTQCPLNVSLNAYITANGPGVVRYTFAHSEGPGILHDAGTHELVFRAAGTQRVNTTWTFNDLGAASHYEGWVAIRILSPNPLESSHTTGGFSLNCPRPIRAANNPEIPTVLPVGGRFRVTLNGFRVNHETADDALERDGPGDEVFLREDSFKINSAASVATLSREGSGSRGSIMHVRTGDAVPRDRPETGSLRFFYEGEIIRGGTAVVLFPVLWEWDSDRESQALGDKFLTMASDARLGRYVSHFITGPAGTRLEDFIKRGSEIGLSLNVTLGHGPLGLGEVGNRPIGMMKSGDRYVFDPQVLILTYEAADLISRTDFGHGPGIFEMHFKDDSDLQGDYTLFLQVQRLP
ncbi:MAG: hypothetical protein DMF68_04415 [Acidobacteria bacterium]|nr:MAG: hypothetical protein DMF68_04415 [Acidobacteriota bacterium]